MVQVNNHVVGYPINHFHYAFEFFTLRLAHMLDSLVRVSRRDV